LNHGYHFFAPDPGPGHIVRYVVSDEQGQTIAEGTFPDADTYWPRLRYHRHFMLADQAELPVGDLSPEDAQHEVLNGYARHLLRTYGGDTARLARIRHFMLSPREKAQDVPPDAPHKYTTLLEVVQRAADLAESGGTETDGNPQFGARNLPVGAQRSF
jgi:hypothetical protein